MYPATIQMIFSSYAVSFVPHVDVEKEKRSCFNQYLQFSPEWTSPMNPKPGISLNGITDFAVCAAAVWIAHL